MCGAAEETGRAGEAVPFYERAIAEGSTAGMHFEFGEVLFGLRQRDRAIDQYRRAIELAAEDRGAVCQPARNATSPTAWQPAPLAEAHFSLGNALKDQGKMEEAAAHYRRAVERKPDSPMMHGNLLFCEQYRADVTPAGLAAAHAEWDRRYAAPLRAAWRPFSNDRSPHRPLRLGFVSCNFRQHPVGLFTIRVIEALKGHACDVVVVTRMLRARIDFQSVLGTRHTDCQPGPNSTDYKSIPHSTDCQPGPHSTDCKSIPRKTDWQSVPRPRPDAITERFIAAADQWVEAGEMSDEQLAEQIRNDQNTSSSTSAGTRAAIGSWSSPASRAHPGEMGRLPGQRRADGHGFSAGRSVAGRGRRRGELPGDGASAPGRLCVFRSARGCAGSWGFAGDGRRMDFPARPIVAGAGRRMDFPARPILPHPGLPHPLPLSRVRARGDGCDLRELQQPGEDHALRGGRLGRDPAAGVGIAAGAEVPGIRPARHPPPLRRVIRGRRRGAGAAGTARLVAGADVGRVQSPRSGPRSVSLFGRDHDLRGLVDGRAGDYPARQDLCRPSFAEPLVERGPDGDRRPGRDGLRRVGRAVCARPAAPGEMARGVARASGPLALVRRAALRGELDEGPCASIWHEWIATEKER